MRKLELNSRIGDIQQPWEFPLVLLKWVVAVAVVSRPFSQIC